MKIATGISIAVLFLGTALIIKMLLPLERRSSVIASFPEKEIKMIFGEGTYHKTEYKPFPYLKVYYNDGKIAGYLFASHDLDVINHGYKTEVKLLVAADLEFKIKKIILYDIKETPEYFAKIKKSGMIQKWIGRGVSDCSPDTVTGATRTSSAINRTVKEMLNKVKSL